MSKSNMKVCICSKVNFLVNFQDFYRLPTAVDRKKHFKIIEKSLFSTLNRATAL